MNCSPENFYTEMCVRMQSSDSAALNINLVNKVISMTLVVTTSVKQTVMVSAKGLKTV